MRQFNNEFFPSFYSCLYSYMCVCVRRGKNVNNVGEEKEVCRGGGIFFVGGAGWFVLPN